MTDPTNVIDLEGARFDRELQQAVDAMWDEVYERCPTLSRRADGTWDFWAVSDTGNLFEDLARGRAMARQTALVMRGLGLDCPDLLWRIIRAMPAASATSDGFLYEVDLIVSKPDWLDEPPEPVDRP